MATEDKNKETKKPKVQKAKPQKSSATKTTKKASPKTSTYSPAKNFTQNLLIIIAAVVVAICLVIDIWFIYIKLLAPQKIVSTTFIVGMQEAKDETSEPFIELKYHSNENGNGFECLDIKYNFLLDEEKSSLYSQGIQYVANSETQKNSLKFDYYADESTIQNDAYRKLSGLPVRKYHYAFGTFETSNEFTKKEYQSIDNYETTSGSTNPISSNTGFKLVIGNEIYMVKFRGNKDCLSNDASEEQKQTYLEKTFITSECYDLTHVFVFNYADYFHLYDVNFLNKSIFESLESVKAGGTQTLIYDFPDIFDYYKFDESTGQYSEEREKNTTKLQSEIRNFYQIKVTVSKDGIQKSSESLFNVVNGNATFNLTGDYEQNNFYVGRSIIYATLNNFELIDNNNGTYDIKLNEKFINKYNNSKNSIYLSLYLDYKEFFELNNIKVNAPTKDSMCGFKVYKLEMNKSYHYGG